MGYSLLFSKEFWRGYFIAFRRFHRDSAARKRVFGLSLALLAMLFPVIYITTVAGLSHDRDLTVSCVVIAVVELSVIIGIQEKWNRDDRLQLAEDIASADRETVQRLQKLAYGLAAVNERAQSELFMQTKTLPEGLSVVTRRIHIDALRANGIWEDLPLRVRLWLMKPDGSWPLFVALNVVSTAEKLHTILWALALIRELRPLESLEKTIDFAALEKLLAKPAPGIRPTWDLRVERNKTQPYFLRCYAESIHRGKRNAETEEQAIGIQKWMDALVEGSEPDNLSGARTVAEVNDEALSHIARASACRLQVLTLLLDSLHANSRWKQFAARAFNALPREGALEKSEERRVEESDQLADVSLPGQG